MFELRLTPSPGFDWQRVNWGAPDQQRTENCSYCGDRLDPDGVPLILSRQDGWVAEFCDHCQAAWFGIENLDDPPEIEELPELGICCLCERRPARHIVMLDRRGAVPGHGWGCVVCGLPADGAVAVLCASCADIFETDPQKLTTACRGWPASEGRIAIADLPPGRFGHDEPVHRRIDGGFGPDPE